MYSTDSFLLWRWWKLTQEICVVCTLIVHKFSRQEWSVRSETILSVLISNIPFFCLFRQKPTIDVHTHFFKATSLFWLQQQWPVARGPRILLDLVSTHFLARSDLFPFSSSVYIPARLFLSNPLLPLVCRPALGIARRVLNCCCAEALSWVTVKIIFKTLTLSQDQEPRKFRQIKYLVILIDYA